MSKLRNIATSLLSFVMVMALMVPIPAAAAQSGSESTVTPLRIASTSALSTSAQLVDLTLYKDSATQNAKALKIKGTDASSLTWESSKSKVATVSAKGKITAKRKGTAVVTAKDGNTTYTYNVAVKNVSISDKNASIEAGSRIKLKLNGDKIKAAKSSNPSVATVSKKGAVNGLEQGKSKVTLTSKKGKKYTCKVTVTSATEGNGDTETTPTVSEVPSSEEGTGGYTDSDTKSITVTTGGSLKLALAHGEQYETITYQTNDNENVSLEGKDLPNTLPNTSLVIDAPNASIENRIEFKDVTIKGIAENTYREHADNKIDVSAPSSHIVIEKASQASVNALPGARQVRLDNNGSVSSLSVQTNGKVSVDGENARRKIPTSVVTSSTIETSVALDITAKAKATLVLQPGSEGTAVQVADAADTPDVKGIGTVPVTVVGENGAKSAVSTVVATYDEDSADSIPTLDKVTGKVIGSDGVNPVAQATAKLYRYTSAVADGITDGVEAIAQSATGENGAYVFYNVKAGNYVVGVEKGGYVTSYQTLFLAESGTNEAPEIILLEQLGDNAHTISGTVIDGSKSGKVTLSDVTVRLRAGQNNMTGTVLREISRAANGAFSFTDLPAGVYTVEAVDLRNAESYYLPAYKIVPTTTDSSADITISMTPSVGQDEVCFVLTWDSKAEGASKDLDSHLIGPTMDGSGLFHTYFANREYRYRGSQIANLEKDDIDGSGLETTTLHEQAPGEYRFLVHDYTNQGNEGSTALSDSHAVVKVYVGTRLIAEIAVPEHQAGTVWEACTFDSASGKVIPSEHMGYESDEDLVGTNVNAIYGDLCITGVETNEFVSDYSISGSVVNLNTKGALNSDTLKYVVPLIQQPDAKYAISYDYMRGGYNIVITSANGLLNRTYRIDAELDYGDLRVTDIQVNGVITKAEISDDSIRLWATDTDFEQIKSDFKPEIANKNAKFDLTFDRDSNAVKLILADGGVTRVYRVDVSQDYGAQNIA